MTHDELKVLQSLPLELKILKTQARIRDAVAQYGVDGLYISFSGGKDSTVLLHIIRGMYPDIPAVFVNTGLEYPELTKFAMEHADVVLRPNMTFKEVITKYGYPVVSKAQSQYLHQLRVTKSEKMINLRLNGDKNGKYKIAKKWQYLKDADFKISDECCKVMKKRPFEIYHKVTGRIPIVGIMAHESESRRLHYVKNGGCNAFEMRIPQSKPIGFWTEQDILKYIKLHNLTIPSVYGDIVCENGTYETTGVKRTGCVFCAYGSHMSGGKGKFLKLKDSHPKLYDYCMRGGKYDDDGYWIPEKGLGMEHVLNVVGVEH